MRKNNRTGKRLHLVPLILGGYGAFLGLGLMAVGFSEITESIGIVRFVLGLGMAGFGLLGIWDGVRDLVRPEKKPEKVQASQFILTDTSGDRSSNVTSGLLRKQMDILAESEGYKSFCLQILPPLPAGEHGMLKQISCVYHDGIILVAFFEMPKGGYRICQKSTEPDMAEGWMERLLSGNPDFSQWKSIRHEGTNIRQGDADVQPDTEDAGQEDVRSDIVNDRLDETDGENLDAYWNQLLTDQKELMACWHKLLVIFGESWHDEHKFFSSRDLELAIEGVHSGKYKKTVLEWGYEVFHIFPGRQSGLTVIWTKNSGIEKESPCFLTREGTVTQVKFWLGMYLKRGFLEETGGWTDITAQIKKK